ncbi:MAG: hypothetical protein KDC92_05085 [Bacteroidetes bacterium]|nr:hypothetical protein [Bacteroidota bacterium]
MEGLKPYLEIIKDQNQQYDVNMLVLMKKDDGSGSMNYYIVQNYHPNVTGNRSNFATWIDSHGNPHTFPPPNGAFRCDVIEIVRTTQTPPPYSTFCDIYDYTEHIANNLNQIEVIVSENIGGNTYRYKGRTVVVFNHADDRAAGG